MITGHGPRVEVLRALHPLRRGDRDPSHRHVLHERHHPRGVQDPLRKDGRFGLHGHHRRGVPWWHSQLAHRPLL